MKPHAANLIALFGSNNALAAAIGVDPAVTSRWASDTARRGTGGVVPSRFNWRIMAAAKRAGIDIERVRDCLDWQCESCGQDFYWQP